MAREKKVQITQEEINHKELFVLAKDFDLRPKFIYDLIDDRLVTSQLDTKDDISKLRMLGAMQRRRNYAKHFLNRFTKEEAKTIAATALMSKTEMWVKTTILKSLERGIKKTTSQICADVYLLLRGGQVYSSTRPDRDLIKLIKKVRTSIHNSNHYKVLTENIVSAQALLEDHRRNYVEPPPITKEEQERIIREYVDSEDELPFDLDAEF